MHSSSLRDTDCKIENRDRSMNAVIRENRDRFIFAASLVTQSLTPGVKSCVFHHLTNLS